MSDIGHHQETIRRPSCGKVQSAIVQHTEPWWAYYHYCDCDYTITESEWEVVDLTKELEKLP
jgi:hypothetical protein